MNPFVSFMASTAGRVTRIVAGIVLVAWGWLGSWWNDRHDRCDRRPGPAHRRFVRFLRIRPAVRCTHERSADTRRQVTPHSIIS